VKNKKLILHFVCSFLLLSLGCNDKSGKLSNDTNDVGKNTDDVEVRLVYHEIDRLTQFTSGVRGLTSFVVEGDFAYVLYTPKDNCFKDNCRARITRVSITSNSQVESSDLFDTIGFEDPKHNHSTISIDGDGFIHVFIGMHNSKMKYYRSTASVDQIIDFKKVSFSELSSTLPHYSDKGLDTKLYTYPISASMSNGDVVLVARRTSLYLKGTSLVEDHLTLPFCSPNLVSQPCIAENQTGERQDLYHYSLADDRWLFHSIKGVSVDQINPNDPKGRNAYLSDIYADQHGNMHIATVWSKVHRGDNTFQKGTYLKFSLDGKFYSAEGVEVATPINVDGKQVDLFYSGEQQWSDVTSEIQAPKININSQGNPVISFAYNTNDFSQEEPVYLQRVSTWDGSTWVRSRPIQSVDNHTSAPISYTSNRVNLYMRCKFTSEVCEAGKVSIYSSFDDGHSFTEKMVLPLKFSGTPISIINLDSFRDVYITSKYIYVVVYK